MVKCRVETRHLGQIRKSAMKRLGQQDLLRQMLRIEWTELAQLLNFRTDSLRLALTLLSQSKTREFPKRSL
jgi:hypothetical protein